jgi:hypothetical protein
MDRNVDHSPYCGIVKNISYTGLEHLWINRHLSHCYTNLYKTPNFYNYVRPGSVALIILPLNRMRSLLQEETLFVLKQLA